MLCGNGQSSKMMYNGIAPFVKVECVIIENKPSGKVIIQRRMKKIGLLKVIGQILFLIFNRILTKLSKSRIKKLISKYHLNDQDFPNNITRHVLSVNSEETVSLLKQFNPDAVVVNGTRIISKNILSSINVPFINTHMGVTPKYRGVHGGYWALANNDPNNCGVTIHLVDQGIDTGGILYQDIIHPDNCDNFNTYPLHQIAKAIPLMIAALNDVKEKKIHIQHSSLSSHLWYHPTFLEYIKHWLKYGIK